MMASSGESWAEKLGVVRKKSCATWTKCHEGKWNWQHGAECQQLLLNQTYHHIIQPPDCQCTQPQKNLTLKGHPNMADQLMSPEYQYLQIVAEHH